MNRDADRRVRRTRRALHEALLALMVEKGYEAVTVQDIIDRADVGRSTFYSHFTDKRDLLNTGFDDLRAMLSQPPIGGPHPGRLFRFSLPMFEHARDQQRLVRALVASPDAGAVRDRLHQVLGDAVRTEIAALAAPPEAARIAEDFIVAYVVSTFLAVLTSWLDQDTGHSPQQVDAVFHLLVAPGVRAGLGLTPRRGGPASRPRTGTPGGFDSVDREGPTPAD